jgi:hypothetical protein
MAFKEATTTRGLVDNWPYRFQRIPEGEPHWDYLSAYSAEMATLDASINDLYDSRFLESASGRELEKLAAGAGRITRRDGENDDSLRLRAQLRKVAAASDGTAQDIRAILVVAFGADNLEQVKVSHSAGSPVLQFQIPSQYIADLPLSRSEFEDELRRASPCGTDVTVVEDDTWLLGQSGSQGLGQGGLL